ncbi:hypothetical protein [Synechococcus sp. RedBA-s]|nr:hypothetical protein [Synechococcus sp. RedBA-s]
MAACVVIHDWDDFIVAGSRLYWALKEWSWYSWQDQQVMSLQ